MPLVRPMLPVLPVPLVRPMLPAWLVSAWLVALMLPVRWVRLMLPRCLVARVRLMRPMLRGSGS
jgi:hypothetical protein